MRWIVGVLGGCGGEPAVEAADTAADAHVPYVFDEEAPPAPALAPEELEAAVEEAVARAFTLNASPVFPAYAAAMAGAEAGCPDWYEADGNVYWYDQCTASTGARFEGYSFYQVYADTPSGDGGFLDGEAVYGVAQVTTADGHTFEAGGSAYAYSVDYYDADGVTVAYSAIASAVAGAFLWDGPEADGTWLGSAISPDLSMYALIAPAYDARGAWLDGGLSGLGGAVDTVVFEDLFLYDAVLGSTCPTEPGGLVSVRDGNGDWYDVLFDGPAEYGATSDVALCDGCGVAFFRGEEVGTVCADFGPLLAWEASPW